MASAQLNGAACSAGSTGWGPHWPGPGGPGAPQGLVSPMPLGVSAEALGGCYGYPRRGGTGQSTKCTHGLPRGSRGHLIPVLPKARPSAVCSYMAETALFQSNLLFDPVDGSQSKIRSPLWSGAMRALAASLSISLFPISLISRLGGIMAQTGGFPVGC